MAKLVLRVVRDKRLVLRQKLRFGDEPDVLSVAGDDGHVEVAGALEFFQNHSSGVVIVDKFFRLNHQILDMDCVVQLLFEDNIAVVVHYQ